MVKMEMICSSEVQATILYLAGRVKIISTVVQVRIKWQTSIRLKVMEDLSTANLNLVNKILIN